MPRRARLAALALALLTACTSSTLAPSPSPSPSVAAAGPSATPTPTPSPSPTPTPKPVVWPLTGMVAAKDAPVHRRPLNVRLPNDRSGRPQVGLAKADLVFEMIVEGGITRFSAVFHSQDPEAVGPVRSYRFSDLHLTQMLRGALVASGATIEEKDAVTNSIAAGNMLSVDADRVGAPYYRVAGRPGPNNEFVDIARARQAVNDAGGSGPVDVPALHFLASADHDPKAGGFSSATAATTVNIPFREPPTFTYDPGSKGYRRSQGGAATVDPAGSVPVLARNVVVIHTDIWETNVVEDIFGSKGLDYRMTGGGRAEVFRDGLRVDGTWKRDRVLDMFTFYDAAGNEILLSPGQSWIHFLLPAAAVTSGSQ